MAAGSLSLFHSPASQLFLTLIRRPRVSSPFPNPPSFIKFHTAYYEKLRYLKSLSIIDPQSKIPREFQSPDAVDQILATVDFLKSKGFSDQDFPRLAFLCPQLFSPDFDATDIAPVFDFLTVDLPATVEETRGLILRFPKILFSDVELCLRSTLKFLKQLGIEKLNSPNNLNPHLLNTRVEKLRTTFRFVQEIGLSHDEASRFCARMPAIFGYSIEENLQPKLEYLVKEMERNLEELKEFPQYFAFSLEKRIAPRHLHLKFRSTECSCGVTIDFTKWK